MRYSSKTVDVVTARRPLLTAQHSTGDRSRPFDLRLGYQDTIWFTAAGNRIGRLDAERRLAVYPRDTGSCPHLLAQGEGGTAFWFTDPGGDVVGRIGHDGTYLAETSTGAGSMPTAISGGGYWPVLVGCMGGSSIFVHTESGVEEIRCGHRRIEAVCRGPERYLWYIADGGIHSISEAGHPGPGCELPGGASAEELLQRVSDEALFYCDRRRDAIGCILDDSNVVEYRLPSGTGPRAIALGGDGATLWFTGREGRSVFRLDDDSATEYRCADETSDLTRLALAFDDVETIWFTERERDRISSASLFGL